ncbi:MAG: hypothetical protein CUN53_20970, partial [Phototrophicales bacterium]
DGIGFIVIHIDNGSGAPGPVIGYRAINSGMNYNVVIDIDTTRATPTLFAMLHTDNCEAGVYEFGAVQGCDGPVRVNEAVVTPPFSIALIDAGDQPYTDMGITIGAATIVNALKARTAELMMQKGV